MSVIEFWEARRALELTQEELAKELGVTVQTIRNVESGRNGDPIPAVYMWAIRGVLSHAKG